METPAGLQTPLVSTPVQANIQTPAQPMQMVATPVAAQPTIQLPPGPSGYFPYGWQQPTPPPPPPSWNYGQRQPSANSFPGPGQRAWFTKEHLDLIEKWKTRDIAEDSKKSSHGESSVATSSRGGGKKGKGKDSVSDSEARIKAWIASTFGGSLKKIADKLEDVDRKTTVALDKKGKKKVKEEPATDGGNSRRDKTRTNSHVDEKHEMAVNTADGKQLDEIEGMLQALMTGLNQNAASKSCAESEAVVEETSSGKGTEEPVTCDGVTKDIGRVAEMQSEVLEYMRCRLDYYMTKTYKEIKALCKSRNARCERKDKGAWELAKQDTNQFSKLVNNTEEEDKDLTNEEADDENADDENEADGDEEETEDEDNDEVAGN
ncbi:hypothetical protein CBR_g48818 [Chara braunii]|uniref:Uncharacterized protein n=1 Tax=Chara braunii TaxID=69332 RepID=A0A388M3D8_CHABU|nr:hypothetical protein CBR_g48818 [Chara braunii]|eukprot:GBG89107.1 hypothetical protein CBR_g48818 [Chara braunii]